MSYFSPAVTLLHSLHSNPPFFTTKGWS